MAAPAPLFSTIEKATTSLLKWNDAKSKTQKPQLLSEEDFVYLILTLKKIPPKGRTNPYKITLPNPLRSAAESEMCLIIDDRPNTKKALSKAESKEKIQAEEIGVSKVLKLTKLKSDYRPFEAKRKLCDSFDFFLADKRVIPLLPKLLGKHFYKKKKIPVPIDLSHKNWKEQIGRACGSALLYLKTGTCSVIKVAKCSMEKEEIGENVMSAIDGIVEIVPKNWDGVRSFHVKLTESLALPIYQALPDMKLKIEGVVKEEKREKVGEGENVTEEKKKDEKMGKKKGSKKGRIHEVRYMDSNIGDLVDDNELGIDEDEKSEDNEETGNEELVSKKRKKKDSTKSKVANETLTKKRSNKEAKVEKDDVGKEEKKKKTSGSGKLKSETLKATGKKKKKHQAV